jgi:hypothetical protein
MNGGSLNKFSYKDALPCSGSDLNCGGADGLSLFCSLPSSSLFLHLPYELTLVRQEPTFSILLGTYV